MFRASLKSKIHRAAQFEEKEKEVAGFKPELVFVSPDKRVQEERSTLPVQLA
jgi:hypothetical protein